MEPLLPPVRTCFIFHVGSVSEEQCEMLLCVVENGVRWFEPIMAIINPPTLEDNVF